MGVGRFANIQATPTIILQYLDIRDASVHNIPMERQFLTTKEASELLGISETHTKRLLREGQVKGIKMGRDWLVEAKHLDYKRKRRPKKKGE